MLRLILGVIVGYIVMSLFFFAIFAGGYYALGLERVLQPDSYEVSTLWLVIHAVVYFCGGILACVVAVAISRTQRTCQVLAFVIFVAGVLLCIPAMRDSGGLNIRAGEVSNSEAMKLAKLPNWMHLLGPALGAAGVLLYARTEKLRAA
jgi:ABC-type antimicrobial peptide transport system permease subunit